MKKFFTKITNKIKSFATRTAVTVENAVSVVANNTAEGYVDSGVKILIAVVIGALLLAGIYLLFNGTIIPTTSTKVQGLFNYNGH